MSEQDPKGFKVVDRRRFAAEPQAAEPEAPPSAKAEPQPPPQEARKPPAGGEAPGRRDPSVEPPQEPSRVGGPTFLDLVGTLQFGVMANLGMIQMPDGTRPPVNLPAAKESIDLLGILQEKTKGNLTQEESEVLTEGLYHIRMAYVAALKSAAPRAGGKGK